MSDLGNKKIFAENLKNYMNIYNIDRNNISQKLKIPYTTLSDWLNAKKYPRIDKIEMLANYFNVEKSDLIESKENKTFNELDLLYDKTKDILNETERDVIKAVMKNAIDKYETNKKG